MTEHPKIPRGYKLIWPCKGTPPVRRLGDKYFQAGNGWSGWFFTARAGLRVPVPNSNVYIRPIKPKPKVKPRKEARGKRGGRGRK